MVVVKYQSGAVSAAPTAERALQMWYVATLFPEKFKPDNMIPMKVYRVGTIPAFKTHRQFIDLCVGLLERNRRKTLATHEELDAEAECCAMLDQLKEFGEITSIEWKDED